MVQRFRVIDTPISAVTLDVAVQTIAKWIQQRQKHYVNVCTTHTLLECHDAPELASIVNGSGLSTPDGMPLVWLGKARKLPVGRVYGPDLMLALCNYGQEHNVRHYLYGGALGVPETLATRLQHQFPKLNVVGCYSPPFKPLPVEVDMDDVRRINEASPDIVWVGLGTPKQDYWVGKYRPFLHAPVLIAVGAAFDFHSGRIKQAPRWMQRSGLEWFFRLTQDPKRLWKRYLLGNPYFLLLIARQWWRERRSHMG